MRKTMHRFLPKVLGLALCWMSVAAQAQQLQRPQPSQVPLHEIQPLWPNGAPGAKGATDADKPRVEIFPAPGEGTHPAVIVAPGGGFTQVVYDKEGARIAVWLNAHGVTAFVLTYRLSPAYPYPYPMLDGYRAMRWVRANAAKYNVDPKKIGMWGFSAGGHLVGMVGTHFDAGDPNAADPVDRVSDRPDFCISSYGRLTYDGPVPPNGGTPPLVGLQLKPENYDDVRVDKHVTAQTPPFFLYATLNDKSVPVISPVMFYEALIRAGVPAEMHIFGMGPHGTGLGEKFPELAVYPSLLATWMRDNGWMPPAAP